MRLTRRTIFTALISAAVFLLIKAIFRWSTYDQDAVIRQRIPTGTNTKGLNGERIKSKPLSYVDSWQAAFGNLLEDYDLIKDDSDSSTNTASFKYRSSHAAAVSTPQAAESYPVTSLFALPTHQPAPIAKIQYEFLPESSDAQLIRESRLKKVQEAMVHASTGYMDHAWLKDEVAPVTGGYRTTLGGWALTMIDSLDLLWMAGLKQEFEHAVKTIAWIDFKKPNNVPLNIFEITIRYLGGLLGAYDVSGGKYPTLLRKAKELGDMLYRTFDTPNRMPVLHWRNVAGEQASGETLLAELGTLSMEFTRLSILTGDPKYFDAIQRITNNFEARENSTKLSGLWPTTINARDLDMSQGVIFTLGGGSDSMYEYLLKEHMLLGGRSSQYAAMYGRAVDSAKQHLLFKPMTPSNEDILLAGTAQVWNPGQVTLEPKMNHLACFAGGLLALGSKVLNRTDDLDTAKKLVNGCIWAYNATQTGIMPDTFHATPCSNRTCVWDEDEWARDMIARNSNDDQPGDRDLSWKERIDLKAARLRLPKGMSAMASRQYLLRPEAIESMFVLYRITGDERLREIAWTMFEAITKQTVTNIAYSSIEDVTTPLSRKLDRMESYFPAETLKYFYLIFSKPDVVSLDKYVFSTEGHPFIMGYDVKANTAAPPTSALNDSPAPISGADRLPSHTG